MDSSVAWPELVQTVRGAVRRLAGPTRDYEDLVQATLEQLLRALPRFEARSELSTFVYRITAHVVFNHWRSFRRFLRRFEPGGDEWEIEDDRTPARELEARRRAAHVHRLLDTLSPKHRIVLVLSDFEELPASRIAEILECPEPTVRSRLRLARNELARIVKRDAFFKEEESA